ncbi:hypothetical protein NDU88_001379 [Pleurodeles waltl]|uniref:Uncharacterized protein n=1 Tax=Pleurodeles waltl TaxID=8319 RepID=A0AAV7R6X0_PLEWA|nr:hypothetical protein NDU88_001379 [Pleurodeles waltl]
MFDIKTKKKTKPEEDRKQEELQCLSINSQQNDGNILSSDYLEIENTDRVSSVIKEEETEYFVDQQCSISRDNISGFKVFDSWSYNKASAENATQQFSGGSHRLTISSPRGPIKPVRHQRSPAYILLGTINVEAQDSSQSSVDSNLTVNSIIIDVYDGYYSPVDDEDNPNTIQLSGTDSIKDFILDKDSVNDHVDATVYDCVNDDPADEGFSDGSHRCYCLQLSARQRH